MKIVFLGIGTNLGNRENNLKEVLLRIEEYIGPIVKTSSVYETEPWGFQSVDLFLNMVIMVETLLAPLLLLEKILFIESLLGRERSGKQFSSRVIDVDIILYENQIIDEKNLKIPHPLMHKRKFVLVPLCEIEPELVHPVFMKTLASLLETCRDKSIVLLHSNPLSAKL